MGGDLFNFETIFPNGSIGNSRIRACGIDPTQQCRGIITMISLIIILILFFFLTSNGNRPFQFVPIPTDILSYPSSIGSNHHQIFVVSWPKHSCSKDSNFSLFVGNLCISLDAPFLSLRWYYILTGYIDRSFKDFFPLDQIGALFKIFK